MADSRITLFAGHYGSGKTNLAVNWAVDLKRRHSNVAIADLDIVNPYFRTKDGEKLLDAAGIRLISSGFANSNVDAPSMPAAVMSLFDDKSIYGVIDVGGDDRGANAVGKYAKIFQTEESISLLFVMNCYRPLTASVLDTVAVLREIEQAARFKFTGLVNNSNLGAETTAQTVADSLEYADEVSETARLPIAFTAVKEGLATELSDKTPDLFPIKIISKESWRI